MPACRSLGAGREQPNAQTEDALFYNLDNTREARPVDYPQDNITSPNMAVARLIGNDPNRRIGPSIILKVMAGDTIQAAVRAFYRQQATPQHNAALPAEQMLAGLIQALVAPATQAATMHDMRMAAPGQVAAPGLTANDLQSLKQRDSNNLKDDKPKAYLNYVFFDNQLNFVQEGSGVKQADGEPGELETLSSGKVVAKKNGYIYVYTSNESQQDVLFDNLGVEQITGPVLEETHYYPFGLTMAGISTEAPLKLANNYKYNGKELNHEEFSDGTGLDWYAYGYRNYDAQIGRFVEQDPLKDMLAAVSPYQYAFNDPIANIDKDGLMPTSLLCPGSSGFAVFMAKAGAAISNIARIASPAEKAVSISAHALQVAGTVGNVIAFNDEINNFFTDRGVGMTAGPGPEDPDPPGWLKKIFQFFGWGSQSNDPETRWEYAKRNAELNNLTHQMDQAQEKLDKYSGYIPVVGGVVKMSEGMQYDKPMEVVGGMGSVGLDLFGGELLKGTLKAGTKLLGQAIDITEDGLSHVLERHTFNDLSKFARKSKFFNASEITNLIQNATHYPMIR